MESNRPTRIGSRYNIIKGLPYNTIPLYVSNKAIALTALFFIVFSYALGSLARFWRFFVPYLALRKNFGLIGFGFAAVHSVISLLLFTPAYYPKFFTPMGTLTTEGMLSILFGVLAFIIFSIVAIASIPSVEATLGYKKWQMIQRTGYVGLLIVMLHVIFMGWKGWLHPADWQGMLPMSLIAFLLIFIVLFLRLVVLLKKR